MIGAGAQLPLAAGPLITLLWDQTTARAREALGPDRFEELLAEGRKLPTDEVTTLLLRSLDDVAR